MLEENQYSPGQYYFTVSYFSDKTSMPEIETFIYIGKDILNDNSEKNWWYFQDPDTFLEKGAFNTVADKSACNITRVDKKMLELMLDLDGLIEKLLEIKRTG